MQLKRSRLENTNAANRLQRDNGSPTQGGKPGPTSLNNEVTGARRVWGTFADATRSAMKKVFIHIGEGADLNIIRKYKPGGKR